MKQGGWTETVSAEEIDLAVTIRRIRHLAEEALEEQRSESTGTL
jgi:hypothetical protein